MTHAKRIRPRRRRPHGPRGFGTWWLLAAVALGAFSPAGAQQLRFDEFSPSHTSFSPGDPGDGVRDSIAIRASLNLDAYLRVLVENASGATVRTLLDSVAVSAGLQSIWWDGRADGDPDSADLGDLLAEGVYTVKGSAWSGQQTVVASPFDVVIDVTRPVHVSTVVADGGDDQVRDGETLIIDTTWDAEGYAIEPDFTRLDSDTLGGLSRMPMGETTRLIYTLSSHNTRADADTVRVPILAVDDAGNAAVDSTFFVTLRNRPIPFGSAPLDSVRTVRNGQTLVILSQWDQDGYDVDADFGNLDDGDAEPPAVADTGDGVYRITYNVTVDNTVPDGDSLFIPITATTRFGDTFTDSSLFLCLSNHPPEHIATRLLNGRTVFRNGDTLRVETRWRSPSGLPLSAGGDFSRVSSRFDPGEETFFQLNDSTYVVEYRIPATSETPDADSLAISIFAQDAGCGRTTVNVITVEIDNTPPDDVPTLDPLPASTTDTRIVVRGTVANQPGVGIFRDDEDTATGTGTVNQDGTYAVAIDLVPGPQIITARSLDAAGNPSEPSDGRRVVLVEATSIDVPKPFRAGDAIIAQNEAGWDDITVELINLEGGLVREWTLPSPGRYVEIAWDGKTDSGEKVNSGPFLLKWDARITGGGKDEQVLPVLFLR